MNKFAVLTDPVRRRIIELLVEGERPAGQISAAVGSEFGISQPAVSNQLRVLRDAEVVSVEPRGARRLYRLVDGSLDEVTEWIDRYSRTWPRKLDALETELARGRSSTPVPSHADAPDQE